MDISAAITITGRYCGKVLLVTPELTLPSVGETRCSKAGEVQQPATPDVLVTSPHRSHGEVWDDSPDGGHLPDEY